MPAAAVLADLLGRQRVDVRLAVLDELDGELVEALEVVRGVVLAAAPVEAQPAHVLLDGVDVLDVLLQGVGVVEAQVALAAELLGGAEVEAERLGVADVEVAVGLGREPGADGRVLAALEIGADDGADEVLRRRRLLRHRDGTFAVSLPAHRATSTGTLACWRRLRPAAGGGLKYKGPTAPASSAGSNLVTGY